MKSCGVIRAENNEQQVAGLDDRPKFFQPGQTAILANQITVIIQMKLLHQATCTYWF